MVAPFISTPKAYANEGKVFVCKYVGTPGSDERLQEGGNPISVSVNAIQQNQWNGQVPGWFSDAHDRSYVLGYDTGQPEPNVSQCPQPQGPTKVPVPALPSTNDPCGPNNATWVIPTNTVSVTWQLLNNGHLVAKTTTGYVFTDNTDTHDFGTPLDAGQGCLIPISAPAPVHTVVCGVTNDGITLPTAQQAPHVQYSITNWSNGSRTVTATAHSGYYLTGTSSWTFTDLGQTCSITITKDAKPNSTQDFSFTATGAGMNGFILDDDGGSSNTRQSQQSFNNPALGAYTFTEAETPGWSLTNITCSPNVLVNMQTRTVTVNLVAGQHATCTFENSKSGSITIEKNASPDAPDDFNFTATGTGVYGFTLDDDNNQTLSDEKTFSGLAPGTYTFTELPTTGWYFDGFEDCSGSGISKNESTRTVTIQLAAGASVSCTFKNRMQGQIIVQKTTQPSGSNQLFSVTASSSNGGLVYGDATKSVSDSTDAVFRIQQNKIYSVAEGVLDGWNQESNSCKNLSVNSDSPKVNGIPTVKCTIVNKMIEKPAIAVEKLGPTTALEGENVLYTFIVTNPGNVSLSQVEVEDDIAGAGDYQFGDSNNNSRLDPGEAWYYNATYTIPDGQVANVTNTVEVCASTGYWHHDDDRDDEDMFSRMSQNDNEGYNWNNNDDHHEHENDKKKVCATDTHTLDVQHPGISVEKDGPENLLLGSEATYTFTVKNTGDVELSLQSVMDDLAGVGTYVSGDTDEDDLLDTDESWVFTASYTPAAVGSVVNEVTVCAEIGYENSEEAWLDKRIVATTEEDPEQVCASDTHTTIVYTPEVLSETSPTTPATPAPQVLQDTGTTLGIVWMISSVLVGLAIATQLNARRTQKWLSAIQAGFAQPFSAV